MLNLVVCVYIIMHRWTIAYPPPPKNRFKFIHFTTAAETSCHVNVCQVLNHCQKKKKICKNCTNKGTTACHKGTNVLVRLRVPPQYLLKLQFLHFFFVYLCPKTLKCLNASHLHILLLNSFTQIIRVIPLALSPVPPLYLSLSLSLCRLA